MACQAHETPAMHVNHYVIDLTVFLPSISFFILAQKRQFFVVENSYGYWILWLFKYVYIFLILSKWDEDHRVSLNAGKGICG